MTQTCTQASANYKWLGYAYTTLAPKTPGCCCWLCAREDKALNFQHVWAAHVPPKVLGLTLFGVVHAQRA